MTEELVYTGLRCIGIVCDAGRRYEAWAEPGRETLGRFDTYEQACRAIYEHGIEQRVEGSR
jgi:hypothetical protein